MSVSVGVNYGIADGIKSKLWRCATSIPAWNQSYDCLYESLSNNFQMNWLSVKYCMFIMRSAAWALAESTWDRRSLSPSMDACSNSFSNVMALNGSLSLSTWLIEEHVGDFLDDDKERWTKVKLRPPTNQLSNDRNRLQGRFSRIEKNRHVMTHY